MSVLFVHNDAAVSVSDSCFVQNLVNFLILHFGSRGTEITKGSRRENVPLCILLNLRGRARQVHCNMIISSNMIITVSTLQSGTETIAFEWIGRDAKVWTIAYDF